MGSVHIVEERAPYLLLARGHHFAVVERRNGQLYGLHCGHRVPVPMTDEGAAALIGDGWSDEIHARRTFEEVASRYTELLNGFGEARHWTDERGARRPALL